MFLLLTFLLVNSVVTSSQYQDCTNQFKNQIAMFEYRYYPGWWTRVINYDNDNSVDLEFANDIPDVKANKKLRFSLHDCGEDTVCIECLDNGLNGYYLKRVGWIVKRVHQTTLYDVKQRTYYKHKIYCTSCQPDADTYHDCRIYNVEFARYWYTYKSGTHALATLAHGYPNWFKWRIVSPPTREFWTVSNHFENCKEGEGSEEVSVSVSFQTSIESSVTTTETVEQKIELGVEAIPFLEQLGGTTVTWSRANLNRWAKSVTSTIGSAGTKSKMVKPGMKWVIEQYAGEAAFNTIKTDMFRFCDIQCSSNANDCS